MSAEKIVADVNSYYSAKVVEHGATPFGVDWNSAESQELRFSKLLTLCERDPGATLLDYGCGYGALLLYLRQRGLSFRYTGFDISEPMIARATELPASGRGGETVTFTRNEAELEMADYVVASGLFNVRLEHPEAEWKQYVLQTLERMNALARRGFAFNLLTAYSDADRMRDDLYYGAPCFFFDLAKRRFARNVALLHDYDLYEFTLLIRKDP